ncbi:MAG: Gfo/Idh/MocA family oxidoreductase [Planctomycetota bacterium]|jgi:predicted dehydrogenase|nr:Gfo/Idh/MocA family oxidoreductase [Planctomycetota bacterium]MDP7131168.1 Gfo/Idh/MocA family oxidoreductase [Planctomycetota bacterium]MDP7251463.1 Gfo/Idh/MocA family oxidoreductase [Planctomycetota bacterium]
MTDFRVGIIGCGGRGKGHANGYRETEGATIVACSDPVEDSAKAMAKEHDIPNSYSDYRKMLEKESLDIVSICTWIRLHHDMVIDAVNAGVKAIHSEKPMAPTFGEAKAMQKACEDAGVIVTFCHQRRFEARFKTARDLGQGGAIGELRRIEGFCPNLLDWGTHWFDMIFFFNNQTPVKWVLGQIDHSEPRDVFGVPVTTHGISQYAFENGVMGMVMAGKEPWGNGQLRMLGTDGILELGIPGEPPIRMLNSNAAGWQYPDLDTNTTNGTIEATKDIVSALRENYEPELSGRKALMATELIFATYESSRRRALVPLPLDIDDSPFLSMIESGDI